MNDPIVKTLVVGEIETNCYLVGSPSSGRAAVIDPGGDADMVLSEAKKAGLLIEAIVNTHGHFDHAGGNRRLKELTGAPLMIHGADALYLSRLGVQAMFFMLRSDNSPPADRFVEEGDVIDLGELSLKVLHTPGHTPGGISLAGPGLVFSGDTLFAGSVGRTDLPGGSCDAMIASIRGKLLPLPDETVVYPGHGPATTIGRERISNPFLV